MFDRFIRLARAKKALREQRYLDALQQASDPLIEGDRRAERIRIGATEQLVRRARGRLQAGDLTTARAEVRRLRQLAAGEAVTELLAEVEAAATVAEANGADRRHARQELQRLLDAGELIAAENLLATLDVGSGGGEANAVRERIAARRREAADMIEGMLQDLADGSLTAAIDTYLGAQAIDRNLPGKLRDRTEQQLASVAARSIESDLEHGRLTAALSGFGRLATQLPELLERERFERVVQELVAAVHRSLASSQSAAAAIELGRSVRAADLPVDESFDRVLAALGAMGPGDATRRDSVLLGQLQAAADAAGMTALAALVASELREHAHGEERLAVARELLEQGQLEAARTMFVAFLEEHPLHEGVQKELLLVDEGLADLDRRLADARLALRAGRLREACTGAMALVGSARITSEAQQILGEARSRMALVDRGLDEVRVALHGRAAATQDGVRHCLLRLEELAKVQVDHVDLPQVTAAVTVELLALACCESVADALARRELDVVLQKVPELVAMRPQLLAPERIDARLCRLGDGIVQRGDRALADGQLSVLQQCIVVLQHLEPVRDDFAVRAAEWRQSVVRRQEQVDELLADARARLADRDLAEAERLLELARQQWRESADVRAFGDQLQRLRRQTDTLEQVAILTGEKDYHGANQKLASMPAVPAMLRTRVYDMKQDLARAQGLEGAFLLRVDEGGEQLVLRGESVTIGNVRQARVDLPVLANLAGRHASIRRSMSFHGGMQDTVVAEDGEVRVDGQIVSNKVLKSGQRLQLGPALGLVYQRPTPRSLSSRLLLQSGFQVAGTDRVLLMKDRGRDGRILLGPGRDVHVTVPKATGEVEVYASNNGQMRVCCEQGGTIDGAAFRGEHPVAAGQIVEACGISFLLLPWQPMA